MRLYVPACGDRIVLTKEWRFDLVLEYRNVEFAKALGVLPDGFGRWDGYSNRRGGGLESKPASLPEGTILECDRVYIRSFNKSRIREDTDYDSLTWRVIGKKGKPIPKQRFWVKLSACGDIEYRQEPDGRYRDRVKAIKAVMEA